MWWAYEKYLRLLFKGNYRKWLYHQFTLDPEDKLGLALNKAVIATVKPGGKGEEMGVKEGDIIKWVPLKN